jgi:hypothetical protein
MDASEQGFPKAARPQPNGNGQPHSPASEAKHPINMGAPSALVGAPSALFSLRRIPLFLVLALLLVFTRKWVGAGQNWTTAQDWIMNQYYEAAARENALRQEQPAPTTATDSVVAPSSSPSSLKQDFHFPQKRSHTAVSEPLRSNDEGQCSPSNGLKFEGARPCGIRTATTRVHD